MDANVEVSANIVFAEALKRGMFKKLHDELCAELEAKNLAAREGLAPIMKRPATGEMYFRYSPTHNYIGAHTWVNSLTDEVRWTSGIYASLAAAEEAQLRHIEFLARLTR